MDITFFDVLLMVLSYGGVAFGCYQWGLNRGVRHALDLLDILDPDE